MKNVSFYSYTNNLLKVGEIVYHLPASPEADLVCAVYFQAISDIITGIEKYAEHTQSFKAATDYKQRNQDFAALITAKSQIDAAVDFITSDPYGIFIDAEASLHVLRSTVLFDPEDFRRMRDQITHEALGYV